jgi:hypothetical protein
VRVKAAAAGLKLFCLWLVLSLTGHRARTVHPRPSFGRAGNSTIRQILRGSITANGRLFCKILWLRRTLPVSIGSAIKRQTPQIFAALQGYIRSMQEMTISNYNRAEQKL